jgi:hypothetical protein
LLCSGYDGSVGVERLLPLLKHPLPPSPPPEKADASIGDYGV